MAAARKVIPLTENERMERKMSVAAGDCHLKHEVREKYKRLGVRRLKIIVEEIRALIELKNYNAAQWRRLNAVAKARS